MNIRLISLLLALTAAGVLAVQPIIWLWRTWHDTNFLSLGGLIGVGVGVLFVWSITSPRQGTATDQQRIAWILLLASAVTRLLSQLLGINIIGALTLVIDVYALATLCGLNTRERAVSPLWLAAVFALSLPIERILQRVIGYPLQEFAASLACQALSLGKDPVSCNGIDLQIAGQHVLVDLPCAGTAALHTIMIVFAVVASVRLPTARMAILGFCIALFAALAGNVVRIVMLAMGIAYPHLVGGIDVMAAPWHEAIGLITLAIPVATVLVWARRVRRRDDKTETCLGSARASGPGQRSDHMGRGSSRGSLHPFFGIALLIVAIVIVSLPTKPVDVSRPMQTIELPRWLNDHPVQPLGLSSLEQQYFGQYGGAVARAAYGNQVLLVVKTSSPLRHIHSPEDCLRGIGHRVRYQGQTRGILPSAIYRSTDPEGRDWRVSVSYISQHNQRVTSVGHAAWLWLKQPDTAWTMVQRISPWHENTDAVARFDHAVVTALDTTFTNPS